MSHSSRRSPSPSILFTFYLGLPRPRPGHRRHCGPDCYDSTTPPETCRCPCRTLNHGVGRRRAVELTRQYVQRWIAMTKPREVWICDEVKQMDLPYGAGDERDQQQ